MDRARGPNQVENMLGSQPLSANDYFLFHQGNVGDGSAKTHHTEFEEKACEFTETLGKSMFRNARNEGASAGAPNGKDVSGRLLPIPDDLTVALNHPSPTQALDTRHVYPVVLFDGVCNLCNGAVDFVIRRDAAGVFWFASLQSKAGEELLSGYNVNSNETDSVVLIENGMAFIRSTAALRIVRQLGWGWPLLYGLIVVPRPIRDAVYRAIAKRRYTWFGKKETCRIPTAAERERFLG